jgi:hypothetical protein
VLPVVALVPALEPAALVVGAVPDADVDFDELEHALTRSTPAAMSIAPRRGRDLNVAVTTLPPSVDATEP